MSVARIALTEFAAIVSAAVSPNTAYVDEGSAASSGPPASGERQADPDSPVRIRPVALTRTSRSHRDGQILDLELTVAVSSTGSHGLENIEALLTVVESMERYRAAPMERTAEPAGPPAMGFLVKIPVAVRLQVPEGPPVLEPLHVHMETGRLLHGVVLGPGSRGLAGAQVHAHSSGRTATSGTDGWFEVLATEDATQHFSVKFKGASRRMSITSQDPPVTLRWAPAEHEREPS